MTFVRGPRSVPPAKTVSEVWIGCPGTGVKHNALQAFWPILIAYRVTASQPCRTVAGERSFAAKEACHAQSKDALLDVLHWRAMIAMPNPSSDFSE